MLNFYFQKFCLNDLNQFRKKKKSDAVVESAAANLGVKKSEILDREADNMALRVLFAETSIIKETKEVLEKEGVCLDTLGAHQDKNITRSNTIILVKNIPFSTQSNELRALFSPFGEINRVLIKVYFLLLIFFPQKACITSSQNNSFN